jgi:hypothetical protein
MSEFLAGNCSSQRIPVIKLANTWIILNSGGGPTPDKPEVILETPPDLNRVSTLLNLRVADIWACYKEWTDKGAVFLTDHRPILTAGNGTATCVIPTATSSRSANILKQPSIGSAATVNLNSCSSTLYFRQGAMYKMDRDRAFANG